MAGERIQFRVPRRPQLPPGALRGWVKRRRLPGVGDAAPEESFSISVTASVGVSASNVFATVGTQVFARPEIDGNAAGDLASGLYQE